MNRIPSALSVGTWLAVAATAAMAQAVPGSVDPGRLGRELQQPPTPQARPAVPRPPSPAVQRAPSGGAAFRLEAVQVQGNTAIATDALRPAWEPLLGREVTLDDLQAVADRLTAQYRAAGFVLAQVVLPAQALDRGTVTLQVYEGFIDSAVYQGEHVPDVARNYVQKILDARPLTAAVLERYLLLLNDVPGLTAHAVLSPSPTTVGAAQLTLVVGTQRWSADAGLDNRLTESLGHARLMAGVSAADTLLAQERFSARLIASDSGRVAIGSLGWEQAWGSEGLRTNLALTGVKTRPELALAETSRSSAVDAGVSYPVLRSRSRNLSLHATLSAMNSRAVTREGGVVLFDDRVRAMRVGVTGDLADEWGGVSLVDLEASQGLGGSAGTPASRAGANPHFRKLTLFASRLQAVVPGVSVLAAFSGQTTGSTLFSSEQFGAGGEVFLRAFDPSELIGDRGWAAKLELRYLPRDDTLLYLFYDHAHVANVDAAQPVVGGATAGTAGLGLRYSADRWAAFVEAAQPLQRDVGSEGRRRARLFAGLRWAY